MPGHTVARQYVGSACSAFEVKVKSVAAYLGTFVPAVEQDLKFEISQNLSSQLKHWGFFLAVVQDVSERFDVKSFNQEQRRRSVWK